MMMFVRKDISNLSTASGNQVTSNLSFTVLPNVRYLLPGGDSPPTHLATGTVYTGGSDVLETSHSEFYKSASRVTAIPPKTVALSLNL